MREKILSGNVSPHLEYMESVPLRRRRWYRIFNVIKTFVYNNYFIVCAFIFIFSDILASVYFKRLIDYAVNYTFFLNQFVVLFFLILYTLSYIICIFFFPRFVKEKPGHLKILRVCVFITLSSALSNIASTNTSGPTLVIISQFCLPFTIFFSKVIRKRKFHKLQYTGTFLIFFSVILTQILLSKAFDASNTRIFYNMILMACALFDSLSICFKEELYAVPNMNIVGYEFWVHTYCFIFNLLTIFIYSLKIWGPVTIKLGEYSALVVPSLKCLFMNKNTITENCGGVGQPFCDNCDGAQAIMIKFLVITILMRNCSAMVMTLIYIFETPLLSIAFTLNIVAGNSTSTIQFKDGLALLFISIGMIIYRIGAKKNEQEFIPVEDEESSISLLAAPSSNQFEPESSTTKYTILEDKV